MWPTWEEEIRQTNHSALKGLPSRGGLADALPIGDLIGCERRCVPPLHVGHINDNNTHHKRALKVR